MPLLGANNSSVTWEVGGDTKRNDSKLLESSPVTTRILTRWWRFQIFLNIFTPKIWGSVSPILTSIFFRWVGSTTNQLRYKVINYDRARHKLVQSDVSLGCRRWKGGPVACIFPCFQRDNMDAMRGEVIIYLLR